MPLDRDLFANFERMRREIDELFGDIYERAGLSPRMGFTPRVDVYYTDSPPRAVVKADLAGIDPSQVALEIRGRKLLIAGQRQAEDSRGRMYQQIEIEHGSFRRLVELGADVDSDSASASYDNGILLIEIPLLSPQQTTRQVPVKGPGEAPRSRREQRR